MVSKKPTVTPSPNFNEINELVAKTALLALPESKTGDEAQQENQGMDICPENSVFNCDGEGVVMTGKGHARMSSALEGIQTLASLLFQRELDMESGCGIVVNQKVAIGLLSALGSCAELAQYLLEGEGYYSRTISTDHADYPALERLANGRPA
jgi:hypothetical protein